MFDVSVIVPVYNVEQYIATCIESLLKQTFAGRLQIILIEDQSPDNCSVICRQYAAEYENIDLIEHHENGGSAAARNSGLEKAQGKYLMYVDPDDILPSNAIETLYQAIDSSGVDIVKGSNISFGGNKVKEIIAREETIYGEDCLTTLLLHDKLRGHPWGKIFRTSSFKDERFTPGFNMAQDLLYCAEVFSKAKSLLIIPDIVYHYRIHTAGATGGKYKTGAYKSWLKCIVEIGSFVKTKQQRSAYLELKIRTLCQLAREMRSLQGELLLSTLCEVERICDSWLPSLWHLVFVDRISFASINRYIRYQRAIRVARKN